MQGMRQADLRRRVLQGSRAGKTGRQVHTPSGQKQSEDDPADGREREIALVSIAGQERFVVVQRDGTDGELNRDMKAANVGKHVRGKNRKYSTDVRRDGRKHQVRAYQAAPVVAPTVSVSEFADPTIVLADTEEATTPEDVQPTSPVADEAAEAVTEAEPEVVRTAAETVEVYEASLAALEVQLNPETETTSDALTEAFNTYSDLVGPYYDAVSDPINHPDLVDFSAGWEAQNEVFPAMEARFNQRRDELLQAEETARMFEGLAEAIEEGDREAQLAREEEARLEEQRQQDVRNEREVLKNQLEQGVARYDAEVVSLQELLADEAATESQINQAYDSYLAAANDYLGILNEYVNHLAITEGFDHPRTV